METRDVATGAGRKERKGGLHSCQIKTHSKETYCKESSPRHTGGQMLFQGLQGSKGPEHS